MRIATWNINGLRARQDFVIHWLRARKPDLVGLQELKLEEEQFPFELFEREGYQALVLGQKAWNGVAVLSRGPLQLLQRGLPGGEQDGARLISAEVEGLSFTTVYVPNGKFVSHPDFSRKLEWMDQLQRFVRDRFRAGDPVILCGDFNVCPSPIDSWNEEQLKGTIFHTEEERERIHSLFNWGFKDVYRERHPDTQAFTWWDYRAGAFHKKQGLRIDLLLATPALEPRVEQVEIDREYRKKKDGLTASDHAPVIMDLN